MYTAKKGTMYPVKRFVLELEQEKSVEAFLKSGDRISRRGYCISLSPGGQWKNGNR